MAPSTTFQARMKAFEALGNGTAKDLPDDVAQVPIESRNLLDSDSPRSASAILPIVPETFSPSPSASPASLATKSSLIDLKDWVIDDGPLLRSRSPPSAFDTTPLINLETSPPKSNASKTSKAPPLPPRKPSYTSLRSVSLTTPSASTSTPRSPASPHMLMPPDLEHTYPPARSPLPAAGDMLPRRHAPASSISSFHSVSLSSDGGTDPGAPHSYPMDREWADDGESLDESFENVSVSEHLPPPILAKPKVKPPKPPAAKPLFPPPSKHHPHPHTHTNGNVNAKPAVEPPKLPERPHTQSRGSTSSTSLLTSPVLTPTPSTSSSSLSPAASTATPSISYTPRRPAPRPPPPLAPAMPPPPRRLSASSSTFTSSSERASAPPHPVRSAPSTAGPPPLALALARTPPIPPTARARYDALFSTTVLATDLLRVPSQTKKRANAGWRGLSVDLTTGGNLDEKDRPDEKEKDRVPPDARLDGRTVQRIWAKSKLERETLRDIWAECDPGGTGSLDRDAFARGMGRIDDELRRVQMFGRSVPGPGKKSVKQMQSRPILR